MKFELKPIKTGISIGKPSKFFNLKCKRRVIVEIGKKKFPEIEVE